MGVDGLKIKFEKFFSKKKKKFSENIFSKFVFKPSTPQKFHSLIFDLLALSGKIFLLKKIPTSHSAISSFSCFKNTFLRTFSSGQIGTFSSPWENGLHFGTSFFPGRMVYILEPSLLSSPWEEVLHFGTSLLPGRMVYILEPSLLPGRMVYIDFVPVFLNFGQLLFSIK